MQQLQILRLEPFRRENNLVRTRKDEQPGIIAAGPLGNWN